MRRVPSGARRIAISGVAREVERMARTKAEAKNNKPKDATGRSRAARHGKRQMAKRKG